ncbi:MAG: HupE/UreJ family protein [Myxococcota bacterium]|nr:HupE/UreJ family protein [Myxococcota bacterium]
MPESIRTVRTGLVMLALALLLPFPAPAHPLAPALLEVKALDAGLAEVSWKTSRLRPRGADIRPVLPEACPSLDDPQVREDAKSVTLVWTIQCPEATGLVGQSLAVAGLEATRIDVLVRVILPDGRVVSTVLRAGDSVFLIPDRVTKSAVIASYTTLGFEHILSGPDHLLFVLGLILLVVGVRPLVKTVTAFTVGHSVTLSIVALGFVRVPSALIEVLIAASVLLLAVELTTRSPDRPSLLRRKPWLVALAFGLLHGMGFAGALAEIGLPDDEIPLALFAFNVGIELGQLAFVAVILAGEALLRGPIERAPSWLRKLPAYTIGVLAVYWVLERTAAIF